MQLKSNIQIHTHGSLNWDERWACAEALIHEYMGVLDFKGFKSSHAYQMPIVIMKRTMSLHL